MTDAETLQKLKIDIWDLLFRTGALPVARISEKLGSPVAVIQEAVHDEWFQVSNDVVAIAVAK